MANKLTKKEKLFGLLSRNRGGVTVKEATRRVGGNVTARIAELRYDEGIKIYTNKSVAKNGKTVSLYVLDSSYFNY